MTWPVATKNNMLNGQSFDQFSLHDGFPGSTGANELTGGIPPYARKSVTINTASGGIRLLNAAVDFDVAASKTVRFVGAWYLGAFVGYFANGGATPKNFTASSSGDYIHCPSHGYSSGNKVCFVYGTAPTGLSAGVVYFVRDVTTDTFKLAATSGGAAIDITGASSTGCFIVAIREDEYLIQDTHTVSTTSIVWPD